MAAPAFGFSVGDFIAGTKIAVGILSAFKEAGGASSKYASEVMFLECLSTTMKRIEEHFSKTRDVDAIEIITTLLKLIADPLAEFKMFLDKYQASLGQQSTKSKIKKAPKTVTYTLKDLAGKVEKLRDRTCHPLHAINSALSLQMLKSLETLQGPAQITQIVDALMAADIPTKLDHRISILQLSLTGHRSIHDQQVQNLVHQQIQDMRDAKNQFNEATARLEMAIINSQEHVQVVSDKERSQKAQGQALEGIQSNVHNLSAVLQSTAEKIDENLLEQRELIASVKAMLEGSSQTQAISFGGCSGIDEPKNRAAVPVTALLAACMAVTFISTVASRVKETSTYAWNADVVSRITPGYYINMSFSRHFEISNRPATLIPPSVQDPKVHFITTKTKNGQSASKPPSPWITQFSSFDINTERKLQEQKRFVDTGAWNDSKTLFLKQEDLRGYLDTLFPGYDFSIKALHIKNYVDDIDYETGKLEDIDVRYKYWTPRPLSLHERRNINALRSTVKGITLAK